MIDQISKFGAGLFGVSGFTLTVLFCFLLGFALKRLSFVPNSRIPTIIIFTGMLLGVLLADTLTPPMHFRLWLVKNGVIGGLAGGVSWFIHANRMKIPILKTIIAKFTTDNGNSDPAAFTKPPQTPTDTKP